MNYFTQIIYASRATFSLSTNPYQVEPEVTDILGKSRANNRNRRLVGVLCFGNGYFLQCLQGNDNDISELIDVLKKDTRHTDIKILSQSIIHQKSFSKWDMKYAGVSSDIQMILEKNNLKSFNPYEFNEVVLESIIQHLVTT
jgi:FAD-dependent sensor of blue light